MDQKHLQTLHETLINLQTAASDNKKSLPQEQILDGIVLSFVTNKVKIPTERFFRLKEVTGSKFPLIVACKSNAFWQAVEKQENDEKSFNFVNVRKKSSRSSKHSSSPDQSSVCGSPLKLDIIADLSVFDADTTIPVGKQVVLDFGLTQSKCRKLISLYSDYYSSFRDEAGTNSMNDIPSLIVLCDGDNVKSVSTMSLEPLFDKQNNFLGVKVSETVSKPASEKKEFAKLNPKFATADILCKAKYDILADAGEQLQVDMQGFLRLELEWRKMYGKSLVLLHGPPSEAKAEVKIQVTSGNTRSLAFSIFQELEILRLVIEGLATTQVNWIGTQERPLVDAVKDLVEQLQLGHDIVDYRLGETTREDDDNTGLDSEMLEERKDLDFTDHLWKILLNCTSYSELVQTFNYIVSEARKGELQPFIHTYNATTIGQMVKDSYRGQLRAPSMAGLGPLQYLAEMGDQKLTQDYVHVFLSRNLVSLNNLEYYVKPKLELEEKLQRLQKLHNTLETVIMLKQCLHLPHATLSESCRQMLKHYETHEIDPAHHFTFSVPTSCLANVTESFQPTEWRAEGVKIVEGVPERLVYNFTAEQPFDWVKLDMVSERKQSAGDSDELSYFLTIIKDSVNILC